MNMHLSQAVFDSLPHRNEIEYYPIRNQLYRDGGGVSLAQFPRESNWSDYYWWAFRVTIVKEH